jgi:Bacterial Ig domain
MQVPVADDGPPDAAPDTFAVPLASKSLLPVLANDSAAYGALTLTSATASGHGLTGLCANASCVEYTPQTRFSGWDRFSYTAEDARGRLTGAEARVRR